MAALLSCARLGVSTQGRTLYCTTFPCHNCAKHIVASGVLRVYFIEPYAKSRAVELHDDAVALAPVREKLEFRPFVGIGPRRYVDLFALRDAFGAAQKRKDDHGHLVTWSRKRAMPALPDRLVTYLDQEAWAIGEVERVVAAARPSKS
jgi:deoxycytidylate deaminase